MLAMREKLKIITEQEEATQKAIDRLKTSYESLTTKIVQLRNLSTELTEKSNEERQRQDSVDIQQVIRDAAERTEELRRNIMQGHRSLQNTIPLLMVLNSARGSTGQPILEPLIQTVLNTIGTFRNGQSMFRGMARPKKEGLEQKDIDKLKQVVWKRSLEKKNETFSSCPICYIDYEPADKLKLLPCQHMYHSPCIDEWLKKKAKCPMCNHKIKPEDL